MKTKQKLQLGIAAMICAVIFITACPIDGGNTGPAVINIAAIPGVTAPVTGATPVTAITETAQYTGTVEWNDSPAAFAAATVYTATITLTAKTGFTLQGVTANFFTVAGANSVTSVANSGVVTAVFPQTGGTDSNPTAINIAAIPGVTAPVTGATPVAAITETAQYTGTVEWNDSPAAFAAATVYTATITLTAKTGFTLQGVTANFFTVAGATAANMANSGVVTAVFPPTGDPDDETPPAEVSGLTATAGDAQVTLDWTNPTDTDFAKVEITWTPEGGTQTQPVTVDQPAVTTTITGLTNGTAYTFTVKSVDTSGNKSARATASATPSATQTTTYTVTYNANGANAGVPAPTAQTGIASGASVTIAAVPAFIKTGYTVDTSKWNTQADGQGTDYAAGADSGAITANITLYAKWMPVLSGNIRIAATNGGPEVTTASTGAILYAVYSGGTETVSYQWKKGGTDISGASAANYQPTTAGEYTVTVSAAGYPSKTSAAVTVSGDTLTPEDLLNIADFGAGAVIAQTINVPTPVAADALSSTLQGLSAGNYVVNVTGAVSIPWAYLDTSGVNISLRGAGSGAALDMIEGFNVYSGKLILRDITLQQRNDFGPPMPMVQVAQGGELVMESGSAIAGCKMGVKVQNGGIFRMKGGEIYGATERGGVFIEGTGASFEKTGGTIYGNHATGKSNAWTVSYSYIPGGSAVTVIFDNGGRPSVPLCRDNDVTDNLSVTVNANGDGIASQSGNWQPQPTVKVNIAAITGVTAPATGVTPVTGINETWQYTGTLSWNSGGTALTGNFAAATVYTATITLTAKAGYTLDGVEANFFTVAGATATNPANSGTVTAVFPQTVTPIPDPPWTGTPVYSIGDTGPSGGKIFYVSAAGFTVYTSATDATGTLCHYLEAAPNDMAARLAWGSENIDVSGTELEIGKGRRNTLRIVDALGDNAPAALACKNLTAGGKSDWFLPSKEELNLLYNSAVGNLGPDGWGYYWSSSQYNSYDAWGVYINSYEPYREAGKNNTNFVRAVRAF